MDLSALRAHDFLSRLEICAFCRRDAETVDGFVAGHEAAMCNDCAAVLRDELELHRSQWLRDRVRELPSPACIRAWLDQRVLGQDHAKRVLAVQVHNHYKRLAWRSMHGLDEAPGKTNLLLSGPPGSGKTHLLETLARCLDVPFGVVDATVLTPNGFQGAGTESVLQSVLRDCDWDPACAARGIVYIDEVDKLGGDDADGRGRAVQQALLQVLEGRRVSVAAPGGRTLVVDTSELLFVAGGAFRGASPLSGRDVADPQSVEDWLLEQGLIPEFIGRFPVHVPLRALDRTELCRLLSEPPDAPLRQMQALLAMDDCDLQVTPAALETIAAAAARRGCGARGLRAEVEWLLLDALFQVPARPEVGRVLVDADGGGVRVSLQAAGDGRFVDASAA
ncbi:AAA domain-containing protein [Aquisalimonas sp. 2447]|uniref:AAA family ATPase n=1 Tax=Aquisalimonas sp. 2447 TaxID=2740807 RepID=UPI0014325D7B|nr:AAA family ATPase [Aquisalimonas sp. 2447]QIT56436.1 AAA domain-containing protein [Aquisalimonas sp. 2447]